MRWFAIAACLLLISSPGYAQDSYVVVPSSGSARVDALVGSRARDYGAVPITRGYLDPDYRVFEFPSENDADVFAEAIRQFYENARERPVGVVSFQDMIATRDAPAAGPARERLDQLARAYGEENVEYGESLPPDLYESAPLEGGHRIRITTFGESFLVGDMMGDDVMVLENQNPGGANGLLYRRRVGDAGDASATIIQGADVYEIVPIERGGPAVFIRRPGAAVAPDHRDLSDADAARLVAGQARGAELVAQPARVPACSFSGDTIVVGWAASRSAWGAMTVDTAHRAGTVTNELAGLNHIFHDVLGIQVTAKAVALFGHGEEWSTDTSVRDTAANVGGRALDGIWQAADRMCADILVLIINEPLGPHNNDDCGRAVAFAQPTNAVAVINLQCTFEPRQTLSHEIGHIFGACHEEGFETQAAICPYRETGTRFDYYPRYAWSGDVTVSRRGQEQRVRQGDLMAVWDAQSEGFVRNLFFSEPRGLYGPGNYDSDMAASDLIRCRYQRVARFYEIRAGKEQELAFVGCDK